MAFVYPPKEGKLPRGASFFIPTPELSALHTRLGGAACCGTIAFDAAPPAGLLFQYDVELKLRLNSEEEKVACGQHMTLYPEREMLASDFAALYEEFKARFMPCAPLEAGAAASSLDIDKDFVPTDPLCYVAVLARSSKWWSSHSPQAPGCSASCSPSTSAR